MPPRLWKIPPCQCCPPLSEGRGFAEVQVAQRCTSQTAESRYGPGVRDGIRAMLQEPWSSTFGNGGDSDDEDGDFDSEAEDSDAGSQAQPGSEDGNHPAFPRVARARLNLTALSQRYNLYFVAYQTEIHVFQPRRTGNVLGPPSLVLRPSISRAASVVGGYQDRGNPHQMNHLMVAQLGDHEVLVTATDDGDVVAYYTFKIARYVDRVDARLDHPPWEPQVVVPREFFHENVGISAWGLAVHTRSRLIAVSSNHHEVTVFAFALKQSRLARSVEGDEHGSTLANPRPFDCLNEELRYQSERDFRSRKRSWRVVLPLPREASNIPSISFLDDAEGEADKVAAIDINGKCYLLDIWKMGSEPIRIQPPHVRDPVSHPAVQIQTMRGWGVMALHPGQFQYTRTMQECLGTEPLLLKLHENEPHGGWVDMTRTLLDIRDSATLARARSMLSDYVSERNPNPPPALLYSTWAPPRIPEEDIWESTSYESLEPLPARGRRKPAFAAGADSSGEPPDELQDFSLAMTIVPYSRYHFREFDAQELLAFIGDDGARQRREKLAAIPLKTAKNRSRLSPEQLRDVSLLRTYETGAELYSLDAELPGVVCHRLLEQHNPHGRAPVWDMTPVMAQRCSMLLFVPELCLVVVGSACGRVALLTATEAPEEHHPRRAFRVEHLLPRQSDEDLVLRPYACLLGVAVSPVPDARAAGLQLLRPGTSPRRWRLILNYMDHTILTYDIARPGPGADLELIF